jgi:hypothetical protein
MDQHPHDLLPGFALGALDPAETLLVVAHIRDCPGCRDEVEVFRATVSVLPYTAATHDPPPHVKQQLFARIHAMQPAPAAVSRAIPAPRSSADRRPWARWAGALAAVALVLLLALGAFAMNTQRQLAETRQQLAAMQSQLNAADEPNLIAFMSAPATVSRPLQAAAPKVTGRMFMQPGHKSAVIMVKGLPSAAAGQTYRCWLANATNQIKVCSFTVTRDGSAEVLFEAPAPIDSYQQVMLTLEPADSTHPNTDNVVLQGPIS